MPPLMAADLAAALDAAALMRRTGFAPDAWQEDLLRSQAAEVLLLCSRQAGKSQVSATLALHEALYGPPAPTLLLSPSLRQSKELHRKVREGLAALGTEAAALETASTLELEFARGSRIVCLPGKEATIRGFSGVRLLVVDEASRVPDALYQAITPMLAVSGGRIVLLSTPWGRRGFFHQEWTEGGPTWKRVRITAPEVPRISPTFLERERRRLPDLVYRQEYLCEFVETEDSVFRYDDIRAALAPEIRPLFPVGALEAA